MKNKLPRLCTARPTSEIVSVGVEVIEEEPTNDMGWVRYWLTAIGETNQKCREEVRDQCKADTEALHKYVQSAKLLWKENVFPIIIPL